MADWWQADKAVSASAGGDWWKADQNVDATAHARRLFDQRMADQKEYSQPDTRSGASVARFAEGVGAGMKGLALGAGQRVGLVDQATVDQFKDESTALMGTPAGDIGSMAGQTAALLPATLAAAPAGAAVTAAVAARGAGPLVANALGGVATGAATGAVAGAATPTSKDESALANTGMGAVFGGGMGGIAGALQGMAQKNNIATANLQAQNRIRDEAALKASKLGYTLDPAASNPDSFINSKLQGAVSGKFMTEKIVSQRNQPITNAIAKESLVDSTGAVRFHEDAPLNADNLTAFRRDVVEAKYAPVKELGDMPTGGRNGPLVQLLDRAGQNIRRLGEKFTGTFGGARAEIEAKLRDFGAGAARDPAEGVGAFPDYTMNPETAGQPRLWSNDSPRGGLKVLNGDDALTLLSKYRSLANQHYKEAGAPGGSKDAAELADAYSEIATSIEDFLQISASKRAGTYQQTGNVAEAQRWSGVVKGMREGRSLIARSLDIERSLTPAGNVNAAALARLQQKGRPLGGGLEHIADIAAQFPKIMQPLDRMGAVPHTSALDLSLGLVEGIKSGRVSRAAMAMLGRPSARAALLSDTYQNTLGGAHASYSPESLAPRLANAAPAAAAGVVPQGLEMFNGQ